MSEIENFDPNGVGVKGTLFGLPFNEENASLILIPVPWEVTVSYGAGTAEGPMNILDCSTQVDLFSPQIKDAWKMGIAMLEIDPVIQETSYKLRAEALEYIQEQEMGDDDLGEKRNFSDIPSRVDEGSLQMINWVREKTANILSKEKMVGLIGGDHSTPLGLIEALGSKYSEFGILQIDAHADLRKAYEGFTYSHASIMYNALQNESIAKLVQVGVRDFSEDEYLMIKDSGGRISCFFDSVLRERLGNNESWKTICKEIISELPESVYISFDIDGLDPKLCPGTGTPVPGGLEFDMVTTLIRDLSLSGRKIIGFDLVEVGAHPWDGNVGARLLYSLCNWMGVSQKKLSPAT
jgi:agmatinase